MGMQALIIPRLISRPDQRASSMMVMVKLNLEAGLENSTTLYVRQAVTKQTLHLVSVIRLVKVYEANYKIPKPKTTVRATFFRVLSCSVQSMGIGKMRILKSRTRLKTELRRNFMSKLPQCWAIATGLGVQLYSMGLQMANQVMVHPTR